MLRSRGGATVASATDSNPLDGDLALPEETGARDTCAPFDSPKTRRERDLGARRTTAPTGRPRNSAPRPPLLYCTQPPSDSSRRLARDAEAHAAYLSFRDGIRAQPREWKNCAGALRLQHGKFLGRDSFPQEVRRRLRAHLADAPQAASKAEAADATA